MIQTALFIMIAATLIQHLGLSEAVGRVICKITSCNQCFVFWTSLAGLIYSQCDIIGAIVLSIFSAYISNWFILILLHLQHLFTRLYEKENHPK